MAFSVLDWKKNEVVFVAGVLFLVLGVSVGQMQIGQSKARDQQRKADTEVVARALEAYYEDYDILPPATADGEIVSCGRDAAYECDWGGGEEMQDSEGVAYLKRMPADPQNSMKGWRYVYEVNRTRNRFRVYARLENGRDPDGRANLTRECGESVQCTWYVGNWE